VVVVVMVVVGDAGRGMALLVQAVQC